MKEEKVKRDSQVPVLRTRGESAQGWCVTSCVMSLLHATVPYAFLCESFKLQPPPPTHTRTHTHTPSQLGVTLYLRGAHLYPAVQLCPSLIFRTRVGPHLADLFFNLSMTLELLQLLLMVRGKHCAKPRGLRGTYTQERKAHTR
jgi:hypothetical protein